MNLGIGTGGVMTAIISRLILFRLMLGASVCYMHAEYDTSSETVGVWEASKGKTQTRLSLPLPLPLLRTHAHTHTPYFFFSFSHTHTHTPSIGEHSNSQ